MLPLFTLLAQNEVTYPSVSLGFTIPPFNEVLTFVIRFLFIVSGLMAILFLLLGGLAWITSGGSKEGVDKAREKIQQAIIGLIVIFATLTLVGVIEQIFFNDTTGGLGVTRPIKFPKLIK
ncbi:MAG: hypothetical protein Q7R95_08865 [bacterium]|nr:hypothetical protein [bacterium]